MPRLGTLVEQRAGLLETTNDFEPFGRRDLPDDLFGLRVEHGNHRAAADLVDLEAQAALGSRT